MSKKKVAVVAYSAPPYSAGGVAAAHYNLYLALQGAEYETRLFTFGDYGREDTERIVRRGIPGWAVRLISQINWLIFSLLVPGKKTYQTRDILTSLLGAWRMSRMISAYSPDVIILSDHGAPGLMLKKPKGAKVILVSHHNPLRFSGPRFSEFSMLDVNWAVRLEQRVLKKVDAVVCPSMFMKKWFVKTYRFTGPIVVIHNLLEKNFLDSAKLSDLRRRMGLKKGNVLIYLPSAGSRLKGGDYVPAILAKLTEISRRIAFYIPGETEPALLVKIRELENRPSIFWGGQLSYKENIANVKACSFGISPSLMENYSMALLEAVQSGVPMIAFDTGGNAEIIRNGQNGYLAPVGNVDALISVAKSLLNPAKLIELRKKTRAFSQNQNSFRGPLRAYRKLIRAL